MNTKQITAALILMTAAGAVLADTQYPPATKLVSTKTRAQVIGELQQARAQGLITNGNNYPIQLQTPSTMTRSQVISQIGTDTTNKTYGGA